MEKANIYEASGAAINKGGFISRLFGYGVFYIPITFTVFILMMLGGDILTRTFGETIMSMVILTFWLILMYPFYLWEKRIRKFRRENGLSVYGNIEKELEQMEFNELYAKEMRAKEVYGVSDVGNKRDLNYWFDLLQKGAISKEEYEAKKAELIWDKEEKQG